MTKGLPQGWSTFVKDHCSHRITALPKDPILAGTGKESGKGQCLDLSKTWQSIPGEE